MPIGLVTDKPSVNNMLGGLMLKIHTGMNGVKELKAWTDTQLDSDLIALGFAQGDVNALRSALVDADKLRTVYEGTAVQATTYDFRTFAKTAYGFGQ